MSLVFAVIFTWGFVGGYVVGNNDAYFEALSAQAEVLNDHVQE